MPDTLDQDLNSEERREKWLDEHSANEGDVMEDEDGEYIMEEPTLMDEGEPEDGRMRKIYLPKF